MSARSITKALGGKWLGRYGLCRCPVHNDRSPSLQISDGNDGVHVHCHANCGWRDVKDALKAMGLLDDASEHEAARVQVHREEGRDDTDRIERARAIWKQARPIAGTVAEMYLRRRGIRIPLPASLRFAPGIRHPHSSKIMPAMIGGVTVWPSRKVIAIHRTFLTDDGDKAAVLSPKCMLGPVKGGAVRLGFAEPLLCVAEGIESALSLAQSTSMPVWACLSTTGLRGVVLPALPFASEIVIGADHDPPGLAAAEDAAALWSQQGRQVRIAKPPVSGQDFNDIARSAA